MDFSQSIYEKVKTEAKKQGKSLNDIIVNCDFGRNFFVLWKQRKPENGVSLFKGQLIIISMVVSC